MVIFKRKQIEKICIDLKKVVDGFQEYILFMMDAHHILFLQ